MTKRTKKPAGLGYTSEDSIRNSLEKAIDAILFLETGRFKASMTVWAHLGGIKMSLQCAYKDLTGHEYAPGCEDERNGDKYGT